MRRGVGEASISALLAIAILVIAPRSAHAYLDPGAGSVLLQLLLGGAAGLFIALRLWWRNILAMVGIKTSPAEPADGDQEAEEQKPSPSADS